MSVHGVEDGALNLPANFLVPAGIPPDALTNPITDGDTSPLAESMAFWDLIANRE